MTWSPPLHFFVTFVVSFSFFALNAFQNYQLNLTPILLREDSPSQQEGIFSSTLLFNDIQLTIRRDLSIIFWMIETYLSETHSNQAMSEITNVAKVKNIALQLWFF